MSIVDCQPPVPRPPMLTPSLASPLLVVYILKIHLFMAKNILKTSPDRSRLVVNRFWSGPVLTGLVTAKDRKRPVCIGPVRFFAGLGKVRTGLGLGLRHLRQKTETGPDFQSLIIRLWIVLAHSQVLWNRGCSQPQLHQFLTLF